MRHIAVLFLLTLLIATASLGAIRPPAGNDVWIAYELPAGKPDNVMCCWNSWKNTGETLGLKACSLTNGGTSFTDKNNKVFADIDTSRMNVYVHYVNGAVHDVQAFSAGCPVDAGGDTIHRLTGVTTEESLQLMESVIASKDGRRRAAKRAVFAIAVHKSPRVPAILERLTLSGDDDMREDAIFWFAQSGGRRGFDVIRKLAMDEPNRNVRKKAIFALTQSDEPGVFDALATIVRTHPDSDTRGEAIFWLGQHAGMKALPILKEQLAGNADRKVQDKAIFAISQIRGEESTQILLQLARTHSSSHVRKQALFWLGQKAERHVAELRREFIDKDGSSEVREMAVFAISQRPRSEAVPELIKLARTHRDREVRKKAIFWLSQMDDPRAIEAIEKIILEK